MIKPQGGNETLALKKKEDKLSFKMLSTGFRHTVSQLCGRKEFTSWKIGSDSNTI